MGVTITGKPVKVIMEFPNGNKYTSMARTALIDSASVFIVSCAPDAAPSCSGNGKSKRPCVISGAGLIHALEDAGIISPDVRARRIVIDAKYDGLVIIYAELIGDERLLNVATTLEGIEITRGDDGRRQELV